MHVYEIEFNEQARMRVQADTMTAAKAFALKGVTVKRLNVSEVISLTQRGMGITDAKTGQCINGANAGANIENPQGPNGGGGRADQQLGTDAE